MKKLLLNTLIGLALLTCQTSFAQKTKAKFSPIKVETPARPANQQDVIQLVTPKLETVRVGFIGLGMRGPGAVERWTHIPGTQIVALCDLLPERVENAQKILEKAGLPKAASYAGDEKALKMLKRYWRKPVCRKQLPTQETKKHGKSSANVTISTWYT